MIKTLASLDGSDKHLRNSYNVFSALWNWLMTILYFFIRSKVKNQNGSFKLWFFAGISYFALFTIINLSQIFLLKEITIRRTETIRKTFQAVLASTLILICIITFQVF